MFPFLRHRPGEGDGDFRRRKALRAGVVFLLMLLFAFWLFASIEQLWALVLPLEGGTFLIASALLGGALAISPLVALTAMLLGVWHGVESVYLIRSKETPLLDRFIILGGLLVWFSPALALAAMGLLAIQSGTIGFSRPQREYLLATDPIAFWQSVGFLVIVAAALAYPAWHYWRRKFRQGREGA